MSFEPGAPPSAGVIPLCVPEIRGNEWKYLKECLDTNFVSSVGPFVDRFERMAADYTGSRQAIATVNGTAALHVALQVVGVQTDDEVLVSSLTFIAPANAIRYVGAWPVFIDAEATHWQMDPEKVRDFLDRGCAWRNGHLRNRTTGRRIRAILPVHILGHPVDMDPILDLAKKYGLVVIEDATEGLGANYKERRVGHLGDIACLSFNGNKIITTGGGGMILTDNHDWANRARYLTTQAKDDPIEYVHNTIGYNYRLTNIQAAMGCAQMELLDDFVAAKRRIAERYISELADTPGLPPMLEADWADSTFWMFTVLVDQEEYGAGSRELLRRLQELAIQARPLWQPMHVSPAHRFDSNISCPVAERLHERAISLPCSVGLTATDQTSVIEKIKGWAKG
jgi:perosamine synthetase